MKQVQVTHQWINHKSHIPEWTRFHEESETNNSFQTACYSYYIIFKLGFSLFFKWQSLQFVVSLKVNKHKWEFFFGVNSK